MQSQTCRTADAMVRIDIELIGTDRVFLIAKTTVEEKDIKILLFGIM
jgi:hypothetical protein